MYDEGGMPVGGLLFVTPQLHPSNAFLHEALLATCNKILAR